MYLLFLPVRVVLKVPLLQWNLQDINEILWQVCQYI